MTRLVSVIMPTHNYGRYIRRAIEGVLAQTYRNVELIVVDDGSDDGTESIVTSFADPRVTYLYQDKLGACAARNRGFRAAQGEYVIFHDADDWIAEGHVAAYVQKAMEYPGANVYGPSLRVEYAPDGSWKVLSSHGMCPGEDLLEHWLGSWWVPCHCILWPRRNVEAVGAWDESLHANQDGDIAMRALVGGIPFVYADAPPAHYVRHDSETAGISARISRKALVSRIRVLEKINGLMIQNGSFSQRRAMSMGQQYYYLAQVSWREYPLLSKYCLRRYIRLCGMRKPPGTYMNWLGVLLLGFRRKERLAELVGSHIPWRV